MDSLLDEDNVHDPYPVTLSKTQDQQPKAKVTDRDKKLTEFINKALLHNTHICAQGEFDIGCIPNAEFKIEFKSDVDCTPIRCAEYPHNIRDVGEIERQLRLMIKKGLITRSNSPWRFPTFIVPKKNGEARIVFDYRRLNAITKRMSYSLPSINQLMSQFKDKNWISTIDIKSGYWHIPIRPVDREKTAFIFNGKVYHWNRMPFGPTNAPPYFQQIMDQIFADLDFVKVYMDDITIISKTAQQHQQHLQQVFQRLDQYKIKIRPDKCAFAQDSVDYLGFVVDGKGIRIKPKYKDKIQNIPTPTTLNQLRRFIEMVQYLYQFIPNLQLLLKPFHQMMEKDNKFKWNKPLQILFDGIKTKIFNTEMIHHPDPSRPFTVFCDASGIGIGAVLCQCHDGKWLPVSFTSKLFNKTQQNWHISEQEIYAVIHAVEKWRPYLIGKHFTVRTDHLNLQELFNRAKNFRAGKLYRWAVRLQEYDFTAKYIEGKKNKMADYLSRDALKPTLTPTQTPTQSINTKKICQLYIQHLTNSNHSYYPSSQSILYLMDPDETTSDSEDDDDDMDNINSIPTAMPEPNTTPTPPPPKIIPNLTINPSNSSTSNPIPHPIFSAPPTHKYNTRLSKRKREDDQFKSNLNKPLIHVPDLESNQLFDSPIKSNYTHPLNPTELSNNTIITNKHSYPQCNRFIFQPTTTDTPPIHNVYDIKSYVQDIPISTIKHKQIMDSTSCPIIQYLIHNNNYYLNDLPTHLYRYVLAGRYYVHPIHQILMYRYGTINTIVIPACLTHSVLKWAHDQVHHGGSKMFLAVTTQAKYWWPGMRQDIHEYLKTCDGCQRIQKRNHPSFKTGKLQSFSTTTPFELVSIDICGPLPQTQKGNRYIVSIIDKFTRFCLLVPVADIKTLTVIQALQRWINLFGAPKHLLSDNGTQFTSEIFRVFTSTFNTTQRFSTPYYPESNGQVERLHRWIKERLSLIAVDLGLNFIDGNDDWDDYIGTIQHAYNSTPNTMTKYSPNKIIFGRDNKHNLNTNIYEFQQNSTSITDYIRYMHNTRSIINNAAIQNQCKYDQIRTKSYNKKRNKVHQYEIGDLILVDISRRTHGNESKLNPTWHGPHEIIRIISPNKVFQIREIGNISNVQRINIRLIKPYKASPYITMLNYAIETNRNDTVRYIINKYNQTPSSKRKRLL